MTLGRSLDIQCFVKAPQRPDIRHRKRLEDAIEQLQGQRLWSLLSRYRPPSLLCDRRGNQLNPLLLALQSGSGGAARTVEGFSPLSILLDAHCDPNVLGEAQQSPLLYAVGFQNKEAVEDLLMARANVNYAPAGFEPPLCVAIRHRMGEVAKTLLSYHADVEVRGHPACQSETNGEGGPTATELASEDSTLLQHCEPIQAGAQGFSTLKRPTKSSSIPSKVSSPLSGQGYWWYSWGAISTLL